MSKELLKQALDALNNSTSVLGDYQAQRNHVAAITALEAALAQPDMSHASPATQIAGGSVEIDMAGVDAKPTIGWLTAAGVWRAMYDVKIQPCLDEAQPVQPKEPSSKQRNTATLAPIAQPVQMSKDEFVARSVAIGLRSAVAEYLAIEAQQLPNAIRERSNAESRH